MRLALFLRNRRGLMQHIPAKRPITTITPSSLQTTDSRPGAKRSYSQQESPAPYPAKHPRVSNLSGEPSPFPSTSNPSIASSTRSFSAMAQASRKTPHRLAEAGPSSSSSQARPLRGSKPLPKHAKGKASSNAKSVRKNLLQGPYCDKKYIEETYSKSPTPLQSVLKDLPKGHLNNWYAQVKDKLPAYTSVQGTVMDGSKERKVERVTVTLDLDTPIIGIGDHEGKKEATSLACMSALYQLQALGLLDKAKQLKPVVGKQKEATLSNGTVVQFEQARSFMDYYCRRFGFGSPDLSYEQSGPTWEVVMTVGGRRIGLGTGTNKKEASMQCFLDVTQYLESCDPELWNTYAEAARTGKDLGLAPKVYFQASGRLEDAIGDLVDDIRRTSLYRNRPSKDGAVPEQPSARDNARLNRPWRRQPDHAGKSQRLLEQRKAYLADLSLEKMRKVRMSLPVYTQAKKVLDHIANNDVTICMAATGSGKTTQIPQIILDDFIDRGEGAKCNIICTQPRRLAAISVADRVAKERGEQVGKSIGYHVRFEARQPEADGSVTFCTTGVFLKQLQSMATGEGENRLADVTHIIVDEVHERDVDTDLLLVVLKQLLADKKAKGQSLKIILMSATIDPTLFQKYFEDKHGKPADVFSIPGRSFPVTKSFMDDYVPKLLQTPSSRWVVEQENTQKYLYKELGSQVAASLGIPAPRSEIRDDDLELPYSLIAATIAHVLKNSDDGHVLVFLPGWEEMSATQKMLLGPVGPLSINFNSAKYSLHLLHSSIPLQEQQAVFEPPAAGVRRVILATNIAETSITIPDVVYVVDTAKSKEQRYDPDRHMSSLVSAWVGSSNLNQRAGRAGRHRSGEYYGLLSKAHAEALQPYQTVEMKRVDLSNIVMHVKALNIPGMTVEEVLAAAIEPPDSSRVHAAMKALQMVGALDAHKNLTSLGRVLLQLPVDVQMGRLVLYGSFFKCLDNALALAAILSTRDPFLAPLHVKQIAQAKKDTWSPDGFRSDVLAALKGFNAWWEIQSRGDYFAANRFCVENFLSKPTLLLIQKTKSQLLQAMYRAGVIEVSAGGQAIGLQSLARTLTVPPALNTNHNSMPLLSALIAVACQPKFGVRTGERTYRTMNDKNALIHPSSVNNRKREGAIDEEKQLYAFAEKRRNETTSGGASTYLVTTTRIDPLAYLLFGAYNVSVVERGLECDEWLPIVGNVRTLDDVQRLKKAIEACMLRVFEGITMNKLRRGQNLPILPREVDREDETGYEADDLKDYRLSRDEIQDLDILTRDVVGILNRFSDERQAAQSAAQSRAATPMGSPFSSATRLPHGSASGYSTPAIYQSRPGTPSRLQSRRF